MARCLCCLLLVAWAGCDGETPDPDPSVPDGLVLPGQASFGDEFGSAVLVTDAEVFVGVPGDDGEPDLGGANPVGLERSGAVRVLDPATNAELASIRPDTPRRGARFGAALALDGDLLVVGAPGDFNPDPAAEVRDATGAVYVFRRASASDPFVQLGSLAPPGLRPGDRFGYSVSLTATRLLVGAPGDDRAGDTAGGLWTFTRSGDQFTVEP